MLDIVLLYFLSRNIGELAEQKGESKRKWMIYAVIAWFAGEVTGVLIAMTFLAGDIIALVLLALGMAYLSFLLVKKMLTDLPDPQ